ncbi:MAG TPA: CvpA family protein [Clostridia bacterium]|nr:CvpA family protein [Clostridia bacterium]
MTIWLLAILLLASLAGLGYRQGAIRVGFSFFGILLGALLAVPLGHLLGRILPLLGVKDPLLVWALGPLIVFVLISIAFKLAAAAVHHKVDVYYKYKAGDLRMALWERLNRRVGLCLGLLNATAYLILISFVIHVGSYATVQIATSESDPRWMRLLNVLGRDLHSTGFVKVARAVDSIPQETYDTIDMGALVFHNPLAQARLRNYPAFLDLAEQPQLQELGSDTEFAESWMRSDPVMNLLQNPKIVAIRKDPGLMKTIWGTVASNVADLRAYVASGQSAKYSASILGRWRFDINGAVLVMRRAKPNMFSNEMLRVRRFLEAAFSKTSLVAKPNNQIVMRDAPDIRVSLNAAPPTSFQTLQGPWKESGTKYQLSLSGVDLPATVEGDRLTLKNEGLDWVFSREE